jgi:hypothetical protein
MTIQEVWAAPLEFEQWSVPDRGFVEFAGVLGDQLADHFRMAEFLDRDVLEHVADASVLDMERLHPIATPPSVRLWLLQIAREGRCRSGRPERQH